jgi:Flp pilus assembly protein TadG
MNVLKSFPRREDGAAAVEFAFMLPLLALIIGGIYEVGNLAQTAMLTSNAAREGARYAAVGDCSNAASAPATYLQNALAGRYSGNVTVDTPTPSCPGTLGSPITIKVHVKVPLGLPALSRVGPITLNSSATMTVFAKPS